MVPAAPDLTASLSPATLAAIAGAAIVLSVLLLVLLAGRIRRLRQSRARYAEGR